jgi:chaperonin cofactor prefoldin
VFGFGPEVTFRKKNGIEWHRSVQAFISRYQALCSRFNSGSMTKDEYNMEIKKLEDIEERMAKIEKEAMEALDRDADAMFDSMDKELSKLNKKSELTTGKTNNISLELQRIQKELEGQ